MELREIFHTNFPFTTFSSLFLSRCHVLVGLFYRNSSSIWTISKCSKLFRGLNEYSYYFDIDVRVVGWAGFGPNVRLHVTRALHPPINMLFRVHSGKQVCAVSTEVS